MSDKILYACKNGMHFYKLVGKITHAISPGFDESINRVFDSGRIEGVLVDLTEAEFLDSTNLGLIARIAREMSKISVEKTTIISTNIEINMVMQSMGFNKFFNIITEPVNETSDFMELDSGHVDMVQKGKLLLATHRELMNMNDKNFNEFKDVVSALEQELG